MIPSIYRGDINTPWAGRAKEYAWATCMQLAPRKITPTDVDFMVECNRHFVFFEMKTSGALMPRGQQLALERLIVGLAPRALVCVVEHPPLDRVVVNGAVDSFEIWKPHPDGNIWRSEGLPGEAFATFYSAFFAWAAGDSGAIKAVLEKNLTPQVRNPHLSLDTG